MASSDDAPTLNGVADIREIHEFMTDRRRVKLRDGRVGKIVRVDTDFPRRSSTVSVWTQDGKKGPSVAKVDIASVVGPAQVA